MIHLLSLINIILLTLDMRVNNENSLSNLSSNSSIDAYIAATGPSSSSFSPDIGLKVAILVADETYEFSQVFPRTPLLLTFSFCHKRNIIFIISIYLLSTPLISFQDLLLSEIVPQSTLVWKMFSTHHILHEYFPFLGEAFQVYPHQI